MQRLPSSVASLNYGQAVRTVRTVRLILCLAVLLFCSPVQAVECPVIAGGGAVLGQVDAARRIQFVRQTLLEDNQHAQAWSIGWMTFLSAAAAVQLGGAIVGTVVPVPPLTANNHFGHFLLTVLNTAADPFYVGTVTTLGGIASILINPPGSLKDAPMFDLLVQKDGFSPCALLLEGEKLLLRDAKNEVDSRNYIGHLANVGVNLVANLIIGIFFHQWIAAAGGFVLGVGVGEIFIFTRPMTASTALARYQAGVLAPPPSPPPHAQIEVQGPSVVVRF